MIARYWALGSILPALATIYVLRGIPGTMVEHTLYERFVFMFGQSTRSSFYDPEISLEISDSLLAQRPLLSALIVFAVLLICLYIAFRWARLYRSNFGYSLEDDGFHLEGGVILKFNKTIPYKRIQNVRIHRSLVDRMLGISVLDAETAGESRVVRKRSRRKRYNFPRKAEIHIPGLDKKVADELLEDLIRKTGG